jgi:hypothetical protein
MKLHTTPFTSHYAFYLKRQEEEEEEEEEETVL